MPYNHTTVLRNGTVVSVEPVQESVFTKLTQIKEEDGGTNFYLSLRHTSKAFEKPLPEKQ